MHATSIMMCHRASFFCSSLVKSNNKKRHLFCGDMDGTIKFMKPAEGNNFTFSVFSDKLANSFWFLFNTAVHMQVL